LTELHQSNERRQGVGMKSLLRSIIEGAYNFTTREKADAIQWHSRNEPNAKWRSIMAKYRSPMSEAITVQHRDETVAVGDDGDWLDRFDDHAGRSARLSRLKSV
jgi:hypothetical protein